MSDSPSPVTLGWPAAQFDLPGTDGHRHTLNSARGSAGVVVMFICNHCPYVKAAIGRIVRDMGGLAPLGIGSIAIMSNDAAAYPADSFDNMRTFATSHDFGFRTSSTKRRTPHARTTPYARRSSSVSTGS